MKNFSFKIDPLTNEEFLEVYLRGSELLNDPFLNKGSGFSYDERKNFGLTGLLRGKISSIDEQVIRNYEILSNKSEPLEKYIYLQGLLNRNETLFYALLNKHLKELLPIVYTPTVGVACQKMSHILRHFRGIYISPENIEDIDSILQEVSLPEIYLVVVTDGERILGLGDLGSDGMGIPIGKVNLYVSAGGLNPACCLPMTLDVGTNNETLLKDPQYLGYRHPRLSGTAYDDFVEKFVLGIKRNYPHALLQWEDFSKSKAFILMERYRNRILSFNDDIQGTGSVALAALISASKIKKTELKDEKYIIVGMGQAGSGIAFNIFNKLKEDGLHDEDMRKKIFAIDQQGLLIDDMPGLEYQMIPFAQKRETVSSWKTANPDKILLPDVIRNSGATVLIGVTATPNCFNKEIIEAMMQNTDRPVIFALSNPTSKSECTPEDVYKYTKGKGLIATGSPFPVINDKFGEMHPTQCNNMYVFPGVGLGTLISKSPKITYKMFLAASKCISDMLSEDELNKGMLLPGLEDVRKVSAKVALAVAREARDSGLGRLLSDIELEIAIYKAQWKNHYYKYRPGKIQ